MIQRRVFVTGQVQGVGFRRHTAKFATRYRGLRGWVRNLPDGRVEAVFSGPQEMVLGMVEWCRKGPPTARVTRVDVAEEPIDANLYLFEVSD